jgi:prepilin signal peptidase PulO-like enzyme (type II secretory pathway)
VSVLAAIWWLSFWTALGLIIGSFLNAVIYRIPRQRSLRNPLWSACPNCRNRIAWYDNLPILSFVLLRGRCRHCSVPIATIYPVVEALMAMIVLLLLDAFMIGSVREGLSASEFGLNDRIVLDWPILAAHIILFACLLAMSAIDLEHYWVDIRFTNLVAICGVGLHMLWTPKHSMSWHRPWDSTAIVCILAFVGLAVVWLTLSIWSQEEELEELSNDVPVEPEDEEDADPTKQRRQPPSLAAPPRTAAWLTVLVLVVLFGALLIAETTDVKLRHTGRAIIPLLLILGLVIAASTTSRDADYEIADAIDEESDTARRMVLSELLLLLPAIAFGLIGWWLMSGGGEFASRVSDAIHTELPSFGFSMLRDWQPFLGFATAITGYMIAGAMGWTIRIVFTLAFGKEAFGTGDIHMMAATGCVAGWPVVLIGFLLTCALALLGWVATLPFKRTRALPLGPWLSISFLIVVIFFDFIMQWPVVERVIPLTEWYLSSNSQVAALGVHG